MGEGVEFSKRVRHLVLARSGGFCERCGSNQATNLHHRKYRSRGGTGGVENAVLLCGGGNTSGCHGYAHSGHGEAEGWSVSSGDDPVDIPLPSWRFRKLVRFTAAGEVVTAVPYRCWAHLDTPVVPSDCGFCTPEGGLLWSVEAERGR